MDCPHCGSAATTERSDRTVLGYRKFRRQHCDRGFNERTVTTYNRLHYPTDIVLLVVIWRLRDMVGANPQRIVSVMMDDTHNALASIAGLCFWSVKLGAPQ